MGTRLAALLPQFLYTYDDSSVSVDIYASSRAELPLSAGNVVLECETGLPDEGHVRIRILEAAAPFTLRLRQPRWASEDGRSGYRVVENVRAGDEFTFELPFRLRATRYTGAEELPHAERWALEYGPMLMAAMGAPGPVHVRWEPEHPERWFEPAPYGLRLRGDERHEYWRYMDIKDEPFSVYPVIER